MAMGLNGEITSAAKRVSRVGFMRPRQFGSIFGPVGRAMSHMPSRRGMLIGSGALVAAYGIGRSSGASGLTGRSSGTQGMFSPGGQMYQ